MAGVRFRWQVPAWAPGFLVLAVAVLIRVIDPSFVEVWRLSGFDAAQRLWPRAEADNGVGIVAIDEASLAAKGQRARPRTLLAQLLQRRPPARTGRLGLPI